MNAIVVESLSKYFDYPKQGKKLKMEEKASGGKKGPIRAVDNISFEVEKGEIFGFLGPNGAGKTTTIRMMTGVLKPTKGVVKIFGIDVWENLIQVKQVIGNVPEMANVYLELSGLQNLIFIGSLYGLKKSERNKRSKDLLKKFELYEKRNLKTKKYSKGMKQRLLLCMSLMSNPKILFLDEPTSGLDVISSKIIKQLIKEYNEEGMTIFLTTHDMEVANELCDRIAIINHGKVISLDTPKNLRTLTQKYQTIDLSLEKMINKRELIDLPSVRDVQVVDESFHIMVNDIDSGIRELVKFAREKKLRIKQLNTHIPKLEEAFLTIIERGDKV
ncbi:MAG: ABC transporter ATP-binding protein [Promethearchaeota archaeon]